MLTTLKTPAVTKWTWSGTGFVRDSPGEKQNTAPKFTLVFLRARYYDTNTGEFISRDPLGYVDGMSLYRGYFVPTGVDPSGLSSLCLCQCYRPNQLSASPVSKLNGSATHGPDEFLFEIDSKFDQDPQAECDKQCDAVRGGTPHEVNMNVDKYCACSGTVLCKDPVYINVFAFIWAGSSASESSIQAEVDQANRLFRGCCVQFNLVKIQVVSREPPKPVILLNNTQSPITAEIDKHKIETQVHYLQSHHVADGAQVFGAIFVFNNSNPNTLAHEFGHLLGLEHDGHESGDLMFPKSQGIGDNLSKSDCGTAYQKAKEIRNRQHKNVEPPDVYVHPGDLYPNGPTIGGR